jgi:hypothetical protein
LAGATWCGLITLLAVIVTGCGDGDRLSAREYAREASSICTRANTRVDQLTIPPLTEHASAARVIRRVARIQRAAALELRDLRPSRRIADLTVMWVALIHQSANELDLMADSLRLGELGGATEDGRASTRLTERAQALVSASGITSCHGPAFEDI